MWGVGIYLVICQQLDYEPWAEEGGGPSHGKRPWQVPP